MGHIQIDYRIACAMVNFCHKPCISDGNKTKIVAKRLKLKARLKYYNLECMLKKRFETKLLPSLDIDKIDDFPKIKQKVIKEKICFGSFQLKQSKSYVVDLVKRVKAFKIDKDNIQKINDINLRKDLIKMNTTIIAAEIPSRHKRGKIKKYEKIQNV